MKNLLDYIEFEYFPDFLQFLVEFLNFFTNKEIH